MGTPYSHVYMKFDSQSFNRTLIYEAVGSGVRFIGFDRWKNHAVEVKSYSFEVCEKSYTKLMQYCIDNSGIEYGFFQNIGIVIANIFRKKYNALTDGENCSEIIGEILALNGYKFDKEFNLLMPIDIDKALATKLS